jgi:sialic acid synthase SpsE
LRDYAKNKGLDFFSTPFDAESVQFLNGMGVDLFKVASFDVTNMSLLKTIAATKKPVILSVGLSNMAEIKNAYGLLSEYTKNIVLLHCISAYPTNEEDANLSAIETLKATFPCLIGHSDHTPDIFVPSLAVAAGARVIEKHFKLDDNCVDAPVSINELQLKELVKNIRRIERIQGTGAVELTEAQKPCAQYRRHSTL